MIKRQSEVADAVLAWKAIYAECFPHRDPERLELDDRMVALAVMLRREVRERVDARVARAALSASKYDPE